jgi:hypothetical protein
LLVVYSCNICRQFQFNLRQTLINRQFLHPGYHTAVYIKTTEQTDKDTKNTYLKIKLKPPPPPYILRTSLQASLKAPFAQTAAERGLYRVGACFFEPFTREGNDKDDAGRSICKLRMEEALLLSDRWLFRLSDLDANVETDAVGV